MPKLYCHDCSHCDSEGKTCEPFKGGEFLAYMQRCWDSGAVIDASDCPGFKQVESAHDGKPER